MPSVRIGCSSWTSPAWTGRFYPRGLPDGDRLAYYARYFDSVEVDSTYYAAPNPFVVRGWARKSPEGFRFAVKMPRDLLDPKKRLPPERGSSFVDTVRLLGDRLGPILLQFPPWFRGPRTAGSGFGEYLEATLRALPGGLQYAVELRDAAWFGPENLPWLERLLGELRVALCWSALTYVDVPPLRVVPWAYVRFIGDHVTVPAESHGEIRVDRSRETRVWADRLKGAELESAFAFFNNHFAGYAPASANLLRRELGLPPIALPAHPTLDSVAERGAKIP